jgi:hypothetical protein
MASLFTTQITRSITACESGRRCGVAAGKLGAAEAVAAVGGFSFPMNGIHAGIEHPYTPIASASRAT